METDFLRVDAVVVGYNRSAVLHELSLTLERGARVALLGANGAGKSTLLKTISGFLRCRSGAIWFDGENISKLPPDQIVRRGVVHVPEGRRVFGSLTVQENLQVAGYLHRNHIPRLVDAVVETFPQLKPKLTHSASLLSGGEQQMLALGRAMMHQPRLLLLDELSLGLSPLAAATVYRALQGSFKESAVLIVEQNAQLVLQHCDYVHVLRNGKVAAHGPAAQFEDREVLRRAFLGDAQPDNMTVPPAMTGMDDR